MLRSIISLIIPLIGAAWLLAEEPLPIGPKPETLRVLYAGDPDSERMVDFREFLEKHFAKVETTHYSQVSQEQAEKFDVVICDWSTALRRDKTGRVIRSDFNKPPEVPKLPENFDIPTVLIGGPGTAVANRFHLVLDGRSGGLENYAHDSDLEHPVFLGPLPVEINFEEHPKSIFYYPHRGTKSLGETMPMWKVHEKAYPDIDHGIASRRNNFLATPGAEVISGGLNGWNPRSVAIGRHGNFLQWGFAASPSDMTPTAQRVLVNCICYIRQFRGEPPQPVQLSATREDHLDWLYRMRQASDIYVDALVREIRELQRHPRYPEMPNGEMTDAEAKAYFRDAGQAFNRENILPRIPREVRQQTRDDIEAILQYYEDNLEYLYHDSTMGEPAVWRVDEEAKQLGIPNRSPLILWKCLEMLESDSDSTLAKHLLRRYTGRKFRDAETLRNWLEGNGKLVFEEGGHFFAWIEK
ncbi:hypothetical protein [Blastopirellula marina]|uniref:Uncharacterized protein n=1 Tax=Blastopirellula marina TaxID=124 RepID=A0A2S8GPR9_9BACT|nr:hypothetical protein [Blastopirellula marina]PQO46425.1 hypothetical protein C5Y93_08050 [Blastopirellula marina]